MKKLKVAECTGDDETNSDWDFRSIQKPTKGSPNPTKGHSRLDTDDFPLFHPACQFSPHFELQRNLKDVAKAKQSFIMTQQKLLREAMLNSGAERQQSKLQRIPRKYHTHDAKDLNFPDGQDCMYVYCYWQEYSWLFKFSNLVCSLIRLKIYIHDHLPKS